MKNRKALLFFLLGTTVILLAAAGIFLLLRRTPLLASLIGALLVAAGAAALLLHCLPPLLCPRRTAERQLTALLRKSPCGTLLYCDSPEEEVPPTLSLPVCVDRREGLKIFQLSLPAGHLDLPGLLALPAGTELTLLLPVSPAKSLQFTGTASPLPTGLPQKALLFTPQALRLPHCTPNRTIPLP